ncbi:X8 domain-containing protein [Artemisia annua]|uniref:X8 domain-containing protein n=1 Tax=Artemisia annua TaxID=35608 RepID=A0A2U1LVK5_ARTAN|nr:X8 domain-containing protein [Artemisia annua]
MAPSTLSTISLILILHLLTTPNFTSATTWCVARNDASPDALQNALNYACGAGADCTAIQESGECFLPDTLQAHASYAFNSFYMHAFLALGSCDFAGTAIVAKTDPSYGTCVYPGSPSTARGIAGMNSPTPGVTLPPPQNGTPMDGSVGALTPADMNMNGTTLNGSAGAVTPTGMAPSLDSSSSSKAFSRLSVSRWLFMGMMFKFCCNVLLFDKYTCNNRYLGGMVNLGRWQHLRGQAVRGGSRTGTPPPVTRSALDKNLVKVLWFSILGKTQ